MKIEIKKLKQGNVEVDCSLEWSEVLPYYEQTLQEIADKKEIKGFRLGEAPKDLVEKEVGQHKILEEALENAVRKIYFQAVQENNLEPIGPPQVNILKLAWGNPLEFKIKVQVLPEVILPDYQKIVSMVEREKEQVRDTEVEETIKWIQKSRANMQDTENAAQKGHWLEIQYQAKELENNKVFDDAFILGEAKLLPGFEEKLEGMKASEEKEFSCEFPANYFNKELSGKKANFKVKVKAVKIMEIPELTDEFAKKLGNFATVDVLKQNVKDGLTQEKEAHNKEQWKETVLKAIGNEAKVEIPDILVSAEKERMMEGIKQEAKHLEIEFDDYLKRIQKTQDVLEKDILERASERVKNFLILREIGKNQDIDVLENEIEQEINRILASYPHIKLEEIDKENIKGVLYNNKVFEALEKFCDK